MESGAGAVTRRPGTRRLEPRGRFDLRVAFAAERRLLPALLLVGLLTTFSSMSAGADALSLGWLALFGVNAAVRYLVATEYASARGPVFAESAGARIYFATAVADLVLWAALLAWVPQPAVFLAGPGAFAAAGAVLLAALSYGGWPRVWTFYVAAWIGVFAIGAWRAQGDMPGFALVFPLWLLAAWWIGRQQPLARHASRSAHHTLISNPTKFGWQAAIHAIPTPVIVVRNGRIIEVNRSACEFVGRGERAIVGTVVGESLIADPPDALDPAHHPSQSSVAVEVRPAGRTFEGALWSGRVRFMEPGRASSIIVIALTKAAQEPFGPARLLEDARRFAEWIGGLQGLPWYRDERGQLVVPREFPALADPLLASDPTGFPLAYLVAESERARINGLYRDFLRSGTVFDQRMSLRDASGVARDVRVVCVTRQATGEALAPVVGTIAAAKAVTEHASEPTADLLARLPVLVWLVDAQGRVVHAQGVEPRRWGLKTDTRLRPQWDEAFEFKTESRPAVMEALQKALAGRPVFDVVNARTSSSGGRLHLRSHFVPYASQKLQAVLVLDTIASHTELIELERLKRSKSQYKSLVEASSSLIWACNDEFVLTFASRRAAREIYGYETRELLGRSVDVLLPTDAEQPAVHSAFDGLREGKPIRHLEAVHIGQDGRRVIVSISAAPLRYPDGRFAGAIGMNADLTALKSRERRLSEALRVERTVLDSAGQAIAVVKQGVVQRCNDAFLRMAGLPPEELARTQVSECLLEPADWRDVTEAADGARQRDQAVVRELRVRRAGKPDHGEGASWCQVTARSIAPGEFVLVIADIDTLKQREANALHEAQHDDLTGLPNRRLLAERAAAALATSELRKVSCAVLAVDLDGFKEINDRHGHEVGDLVLREIAMRLTRVMRPQDTVARRGGDEFAVLVPDVGALIEVERISLRLLHVISQPVHLSGTLPTLSVSASIGVALAPEQGRDLERLLQLADLAMYDAKLKGKNRFAFAQGAVLPANVTPLVPRVSRSS
jgi:diguanylate cyclase (GGDEF)-like protein/PAS domain S-box-containing protein